MPGGRPTTYDPKYCQAVIEHMAEGASLTSFAASVMCSRSTINEWMAANPEFSEAVKIGKALCATWWEKVSRTNAVEGGGNATLCIFGLKNMAPDEWREKQEIEHSGSIDINKMSDEELERKIAELSE
jgi:hypothetical protein